MSTQIRAEDLHAGDWVESPDNQKPVWVSIRGRPDTDGKRRFLLGRGSISKKNDVIWGPDEPVMLLSRWPEFPSHFNPNG